jgi:hypothetical protein
MSVKDILRKNFFVDALLKRRRIGRWIRQGNSIPVPHDIKQLTILYHATAHKLGTLVETGTYLGDMVWAQRNYFKKIYSIELSEELYKRAVERFRNQPNVELVQGDSSEKISLILSKIDAPVLFWLDGHYSGGITAKGEKVCPIYAELTHVFNSPYSHLILIDDARLFTGKDDYPTQEELRQFVSNNSSYNLKVENDIIILSK